jgi:hypothetical protein
MLPQDEIIAGVIRHHREIQRRMRQEFDQLLFLAIDLEKERDGYAIQAKVPLLQDDRLSRFLNLRLREAHEGSKVWEEEREGEPVK